MSDKKRAVIGFKGLTLAPIEDNRLTRYETGVAKELPFAGGMTSTSKESSTDLYYDDELYAQVKNVPGSDIEIRIAQVTLAQLQEYGMGTFDETTQTFEGDFAAFQQDEFLHRFLASCAVA